MLGIRQETPDMTTQLNTLKTELREFIELSKTISSGEWSISEATTKQAEINFSFIARARNISPAMAECLLVAVETMSSVSESDTGKCFHTGIAEELLQQILNIWEASK